MEKMSLKEILSKHIDPEKGCFSELSFAIDDMSFEVLRDRIIGIGRIEEENLDDHYYVIAHTSGKSAFANAMTLVKYKKNEITLLSYAIEGFFKQDIAKNNNEMVRDIILGKSVPRKKKGFLSFSIIISIALISVIVLTIVNGKRENIGSVVQNEDPVPVIVEQRDMISEYNTLVQNYNTLADEYNNLISTVSVGNLTNIRKQVPKKDQLSDTEKTHVDEHILRSTESELEELIVDYQLISQLKHPDEKWIIERLESIKEITGIEAITENNDFDGLLGKENSYYSCIYFSLDEIPQESIPGKTIAEKGTDCGGAIELFSTLEDANNRCKYLGQFDNTLLYSGSYAILGNMVIRTSYFLSNEKQIEITRKIVDELTKIY